MKRVPQVPALCHALPTGFLQAVSPRACVLSPGGSTLEGVEHVFFPGQIRGDCCFRAAEVGAIMRVSVSCTASVCSQDSVSVLSIA